MHSKLLCNKININPLLTNERQIDLEIKALTQHKHKAYRTATQITSTQSRISVTDPLTKDNKKQSKQNTKQNAKKISKNREPYLQVTQKHPKYNNSHKNQHILTIFADDTAIYVFFWSPTQAIKYIQ